MLPDAATAVNTDSDGGGDGDIYNVKLLLLVHSLLRS
jgi:hypothetical protein